MTDPDAITRAAWLGAQYTREQWLNRMLGHVLDMYESACGASFEAPRIRVSCGWAGVAPGGRVDCVRGACYGPLSSGDDTHEIFISPMLDDGATVVETLCHEVTHAVAGIEANHGTTFTETGARIGMIGVGEESLPGPILRAAIAAWLADAPVYPHAILTPPPPEPSPSPDPTPTPTQTTRQLKATCSGCGYVIRVTMKWASRGLPTCTGCGIGFMLTEKNGGNDT